MATLATASLLAVAVPMTASAAPGNGVSEVTVSVKSLRTGPNTVDGLAGVTMGLFADTAANVPGAAVPGLTCVTLANGACTISVPLTNSGEANNKRFWVGEIAAPAGYYLNGTFNTGHNTTTGNERFASTPAAFRTPVLNNSAVSMPNTGSMPSNATLPPGFQAATGDRWVTGNAFSVSKDNYDYQPTCTGLKVGILTDLSLSMDGAGLQGAQAAAKAFVNSLKDKGVAVTLFTFSTEAPANGNNNATFGPTVVTSANLSTFNNKIDGYTPDDYTNWDRGLAQMVGLVDVAVVLTDGNPTAYGSANPELWTNLQKNQEAVYSANALKNGKTQILAFGVGNGISGPADNLIAISGPNAWDGTSGNVAAADYFQTTDWNKVSTGLTSLAQSVTCQVPVEVTKTEILANGTSQAGQNWQFTASKTGDGTLSTPLAKNTDSNGKASWLLSLAGASQKGTVSLTEDMKTSDWNFVSVTCTNNGSPFAVANELPIVLTDLKVGYNIKCAVTNTLPQAATIKVIKKWVIDGGTPVDNGQQPAGLAAQLTVGGVDKNWNTVLTGYVQGAPGVAIGETTTDTSELCSITDKKLTAPSTQTLPYQAVLASTTNEFTITNYVTCTTAPQLQLTKVVTGGVVPANKWILSATAAGNPVISGAGGVAYTNAKAGVEYALAEAPIQGFDGSQFTKSAWVCTITAGPGTGNKLTVTDDKITLANGTKVECVITNTAKNVVPGFDKAPGSATFDAATATWNVTYTLTASNPSAILPITYDLTDTPALPAGVTGNSAKVQLQGGPVVDVPWTSGQFLVADDAVIAAGGPAKVYTVTLNVTVAPSVVPAKLQCANPSSGMDNDATLTPVGGTAITDDACVTITPPTVSHTKVLQSVEQNPNGTWTVIYKVTVTATGNGGALYNLSDEPKLGAGITATGSATGPAQAGTWNGGANKVLATNESVSAGSPDVYTITLIATVAAGVAGTPAADCTLGAGESGTGFLNTATITVNGASNTQEDCGSPVKPTVEKKWVSTNQNPDSTYTVTFEVKVTNPSTVSGIVYSLTDTPQFLTGVTTTGQTIAVNGGAASAWNGTDPLATQRALAKNTSDSYVIVFTVDVPAGQDPTKLECNGTPLHGFFNGATMTSGSDSTFVKDCGAVKEGVLPLIEKAVKPGYPKQIVGGDWVIQYEVTVSTPVGNTLAARYDLNDTLKFGAGFTIQSYSIAGPGTINPNWTGRGANTSVATNVLLPAATTHTYTVSATVRLDAGVIPTTAADCVLKPAEDGTGFLNTVLLKSGTLERSAEACKSPAAPTFTKGIVGAPVKGADGKYTITYTLMATNASELELNYDLDDTLGFASGVTINSAKVAAPGIVTNAGWNGAGATRVVTGKAMLPDTVDVYTVTVVATPTVAINDADLACKPATPGKGYFNGAELASGADRYKDDACGPITKVVPPALASTGSEVYGGLGVAGFVLLALGAAFVVMRKRRQPKH